MTMDASRFNELLANPLKTKESKSNKVLHFYYSTIKVPIESTYTHTDMDTRYDTNTNTPIMI
jgi:hypothetical protein